MSVYKILIGKDMPPQNKNTYLNMGRFFWPDSVLWMFVLRACLGTIYSTSI